MTEVTAVGPDGSEHVFPEGTDPAIVDKAMKSYIASLPKQEPSELDKLTSKPEGMSEEELERAETLAGNSPEGRAMGALGVAAPLAVAAAPLAAAAAPSLAGGAIRAAVPVLASAGGARLLKGAARDLGLPEWAQTAASWIGGLAGGVAPTAMAAKFPGLGGTLLRHMITAVGPKAVGEDVVTSLAEKLGTTKGFAREVVTKPLTDAAVNETKALAEKVVTSSGKTIGQVVKEAGGEKFSDPQMAIITKLRHIAQANAGNKAQVSTVAKQVFGDDAPDALKIIMQPRTRLP